MILDWVTFGEPLTFWQMVLRIVAAVVFGALIGVELEKRKTGKYPDKLENPPVDPFNGKPMTYRKGLLTLNDPVWIGGREKFDNKAVRQAEGGEIVSAGPNRKNDVGARLIFKKGNAIDGPDGPDGLDGQRRAKQSGGKNAKKKNQ